ncbi:MAG TPA: hypothetical protein VHK63_09070 [Candidatus Limnocylindria bacterium]|nr:hypothetical protein [Candidatus Limnocylindria bacterium]
MRPELVAYLVAVLATPLLMAGLGAFALVRRYAGRPIPAWASWTLALVVGFSLSAAFVLIPPEWVLVAALSLAPLGIVWLELRRGARRNAGFLLLGLSLPGAVWWGRFVVEDLLDPLVDYDPALLLWWAPPLLGLAVALVLLALPDRPHRARIGSRPTSVARDPLAVANAFQEALQIGPFTLPGLVAEGIAFATLAIGVSLALGAGLPWPVVILAGGAVFALLSAGLWFLALPRKVRLAWEGFAVVGHLDLERWRQRIGGAVPNTLPKMHAWLRDTEDTPANRAGRAELLTVVGRLDEARAAAERIEPETPIDELERAALLDYVDWTAGDEVDFEDVQRRAESFGAPGSNERAYALGVAALAVARDRANAGGDWMTPLVAFRLKDGAIGRTWFRQDVLRPRLVIFFVFGLVISALLVFAGQLLPVA